MTCRSCRCCYQTFGGIGVVYAGLHCQVGRFRGTHDLYNSGYAGEFGTLVGPRFPGLTCGCNPTRRCNRGFDGCLEQSQAPYSW